MTIIDQALVDKVSSEAKASPRLRMNYNFHQSLEDKTNQGDRNFYTRFYVPEKCV